MVMPGLMFQLRMNNRCDAFISATSSLPLPLAYISLVQEV